MNAGTLRAADILFIILPTVAFGGASILFRWITTECSARARSSTSPTWVSFPLRPGC